MGQRLYRIIRSDRPALDDFKSHKEIGKLLLDDRWRHEWESGISTFDTLDYAIQRARALRFKVGTWVIALDLPDDGSVEFRQTGGDPHHFTIYGRAQDLLALVSGSATSAKE